MITALRRLAVRAGAVLADLVESFEPPTQPVPATDDPEVAATWYTNLRAQRNPPFSIRTMFIREVDATLRH